MDLERQIKTTRSCAVNGDDPGVQSPDRRMTRPDFGTATRPARALAALLGSPRAARAQAEVERSGSRLPMASALRRRGAILVLTLAALAAPLSVAQAQTVLWEQTLTVGTSLSDFGWNDSGGFTGASLSDSDETFEYDGHTYDVESIYYAAGSFELILLFNIGGVGDLGTKATRDKLTFHVGASAYNLGTAEGFTDANKQIAWGRVLNWSAGDMLALQITTTDPGAPGLTATAGVAAVTLNWTAPTSSGGTAITGYEYRQRTGDAYAADAWTAIANSASLTSYDVTGLTAGTAYTFQLRARNASGAGVYSDEVTVTPAQAAAVLVTNKVSVDGTYAIGATITLNVVFTAPVTVSGTPQLALDVGGQTRQADYASGSPGTELVFSYTVAEGDEDTDGITALESGLTLNGGEISAGGTAATLNVVATSFSGLLVDGVRPRLASATVAEDGNSIDLVFDEPYDPTAVAGLTTSIDFSVTADGSPVTIGGLVYGTEEGMTLNDLTPAITHGQIVIVSYTDDAANDAPASTLQDAAGNDVASFTTGSGGVPAVVNNVLNATPTFLLDSTTREVTENSPAGTNVGDPVTATDDDNDTLTYTLEGTDAASFDIVSASGQIQTKSGVTYDYETTPSYAVVVKADDSNGGTDTIAVAINLLAVDETDRAALVALYNATGGANWTNNTNWLSNEALSEWHGVTTDANGRVTGLILHSNQLSGEIPAELGDLTNLQKLYLNQNQLSGEIPAELGNLANLQELVLWANELSGEIPAELGNLANLQSLYLYSNELSGEIPEELGDLASLKFLYLNQNQLSGEIPAELGNLAELQFLHLSLNNLSGEIPAELGDLANLRELFLHSNELSGEIPAELGNLAELQWLDLWSNTLSGEIPAELGDLTDLQRLYLDRNQLSGEIPAELGGLTNLQELFLHSNMLSGEIPPELGNLAELLRLDLNQNQLSGEIPEELGDLASLKFLYLFSNELSGEIPAELGNLAELQRLYLFSNQLSGEIPAELGDLANLQRLILHDNMLSGEIPPELGDLDSLQILYLHDNMLSGEIPAELGDLANLQRLYLSQNNLSGEIPAELGDLAELQRLYLHSNELTGEIPSWLVNLMELLELSLWSNQLPRMIPDEVAPAQDRAALRVLYNATGGANWTNNTNWLSNEPLSEWYGVSTDGQGRVDELRLSANGLTGMIGAELGVLTHLQRLYLWSNELSGEIPAELGRLANLEFLYLDHNRLSGEIPAELGNLASLRELYLWANELSGPLPLTLSALSQLSVLDIRETTLCAPVDTAFQAWLATINFQGTVCVAPPPPPPSPPPSPPGGGGGGGGGSGGVRQTVPDAPSNLLVDGTDGAVTLTWDAPEDDGGAALTDYEYRIDRRNPWISTGSTGTTHTVTGLVNGTAYVFEVRAVNRIGRSRASNRAEGTPEAPEVLDFAHFANGTGITSDFVLVNVDPHPIRPAIYFYDTEGNPIAAESVLDVTGDLEVTDDGGLTVRTEMEPLSQLTISTHGQGALVSGSVKVVSDGLIGGGVRYGIPEIGVAGVGASPPVRDVLFPARRQAGGIRTAAALHNLGEEPIEVSCRLMSGGVALEEVEIPLAANGQASWFIEDAFTATDTADFAGSVRCTAPGRGRFTAIAVEMDAAQRIFNTLSVVPVDRTGGGGGETVLDFAHFVNGTWITDLVFLNLSTEASRPAPTPFHTDILPSRPEIYFYDTEGNPIAAESVVDVTGDLEITEDGALTVRTKMEPLGVLTISTHGRGELVTGSVKVVSDGPIGGMLRFEHPAFGVAGAGASPPVSDALFPVRRQEGGITTGVALHNLESSAGLVHCDLMREGVLLDAVSIPLEANGQTAWLIDQAFPGTDTSDFAGSVRCDAVGEGLFSAVALEMDPGTRIFATLPVVPVPERTSQE